TNRTLPASCAPAAALLSSTSAVRKACGPRSRATRPDVRTPRRSAHVSGPVRRARAAPLRYTLNAGGGGAPSSVHLRFETKEVVILGKGPTSHQRRRDLMAQRFGRRFDGRGRSHGAELIGMVDD